MEIHLDSTEKSPLYLQLYKQLKYKINNELAADSKLPPIRKLADKIDVNPATVVKAYDLLADEKLIYKKVGSGSFVAPQDEELQPQNKDDMLKHGQIKLSECINFASAAPSTNLFPVDEFKYAINQVLDRDQGEAFSYQKSQGFLPLRKSIKKYFEKRGIHSTLKQIQVVSGAQQAIDIVGKILLDYGDQIIVENPTYFGALQAFGSRKAEIKSVSMEESGADLKEMESYLQKNDIKFFFSMQNFQNPTGVSWSLRKQQKLLQLAEKYDFYIIEDDILSDLYYNSEKMNTLKEIDQFDRVIYIKSFSKVLMPGLRLAYIILPEKLLPEILEAKYATDISSGGLTQRAFDYYLREGLLDKHIDSQRKLFKKRFDLMRSEIEKELPLSVEIVFNSNGGLYFWLKLPKSVNSREIYQLSAEAGLVFSPGYLFTLDNSFSNYIRFSFAAVNEEEIREGIRIFKKVYSNYLGGEKEAEYSPLL